MNDPMELTMFERLLQLPLFQGLTTQEISDVMSHVRLDFVKFHKDDEIVMQDEPCRKLIYIISGEVATEYRDPEGRFILAEHLPNIGAIEPYNMFGLYQKHSRTYTFTTDGITLAIDKAVVLKHLLANNIIKINFLNITSSKYQQTLRLIRDFPDGDVRSKIVKFMLSYCIVPRGKKDIQIKMKELANIIHETRLNVSIALNDMQEQGLLVLQRGGFSIEELQNLYR